MGKVFVTVEDGEVDECVVVGDPHAELVLIDFDDLYGCPDDCEAILAKHGCDLIASGGEDICDAIQQVIDDCTDDCEEDDDEDGDEEEDDEYMDDDDDDSVGDGYGEDDDSEAPAPLVDLAADHPF